MKKKNSLKHMIH